MTDFTLAAATVLPASQPASRQRASQPQQGLRGPCLSHRALPPLAAPTCMPSGSPTIATPAVLALLALAAVATHAPRPCSKQAGRETDGQTATVRYGEYVQLLAALAIHALRSGSRQAELSREVGREPLLQASHAHCLLPAWDAAAAQQGELAQASQCECTGSLVHPPPPPPNPHPEGAHPAPTWNTEVPQSLTGAALPTGPRPQSPTKRAPLLTRTTWLLPCRAHEGERHAGELLPPRHAAAWRRQQPSAGSSPTAPTPSSRSRRGGDSREPAPHPHPPTHLLALELVQRDDVGQRTVQGGIQRQQLLALDHRLVICAPSGCGERGNSEAKGFVRADACPPPLPPRYLPAHAHRTHIPLRTCTACKA